MATPALLYAQGEHKGMEECLLKSKETGKQGGKMASEQNQSGRQRDLSEEQ